MFLDYVEVQGVAPSVLSEPLKTHTVLTSALSKATCMAEPECVEGSGRDGLVLPNEQSREYTSNNMHVPRLSVAIEVLRSSTTDATALATPAVPCHDECGGQRGKLTPSLCFSLITLTVSVTAYHIVTT